jgi:hypothetical protein
MLTTSLLIIASIGLLVGSVLGGLILWGLARGLGKIPNAGFGNSFLVCLLSTTILIALWTAMWQVLKNDRSFVGMAPDELLGMVLVFNLVAYSITFITVGKLVWKCQWLQSLKANILVIIANASLMAWALSKFTTG